MLCDSCVADLFEFGDQAVACPSCGAKVATGAAATPPAAPPAAPVGRPVPSSHAKDLALLGLSHEASVPEVKRAYRTRALMVHPDKAGGSKATFIELTDAHDRILERLAPNANTFGALEGERAMVLRRILNDVAKDEWKARLRRESAGTLRALKAQLLGTAASARGRKRAVAALGDDERAADAPTATIRGIMRKVKHGQIRYHLRMSSQGLILETEESQDLDEVLEVRSELMLLKGAAGAARREARGDGAVPEEAWKVFGRSSALLFFTAEAGCGVRKVTAKTCDIDTAIDFGQRLRAATRTSGKAAVSPEQKRQKEELLARRRCAASTDASLQLVAFIEALQAPPVTRRLIGKQPPPQRLAITPAVAAQPALEDAPPLPAPSQAAGQGPAAQASRASDARTSTAAQASAATAEASAPDTKRRRVSWPWFASLLGFN